MSGLRAFGAAVRFLTRIAPPSSSAPNYGPDDLARSTVYFPAVGLIVGLFGAGIYWLAHLGWPPFVAAALATAGTVWLTGAFHEDALADACDGFGGGWDRAQVLTIMKDSRVGAYGAIGVGLALILKIGTLATLSPEVAIRALVAAHVLGRWSSLPLIRWLPYVRDTPGTGTSFIASVTPIRLSVGTTIAVLIVSGALGMRAIPAFAVATLLALAAGAYFRRRIGGITGDCLGAANQVVEMATYLVLAFRPVG